MDSKKRLTYITKIYIALILLFFAFITFSNFDKIKEIDYSIDLPLFFLSVFLFILNTFFAAIIWYYSILKKLIPLKLSQIFYIQSISNLGKYLPGKVGAPLGKYIFLKKRSDKDSNIISSIIYENIFIILSAFLTSIPLLIKYFFNEINSVNYFAAFLFILLLAITLHPKIFNFIVTIFLKLTKQNNKSLYTTLSLFDILKALFFYSLNMLFMGFSFFVLVSSYTDVSISYLPIIAGVSIFSGVMGLIAIFAPAGIGVREGLIVLLLSRIYPVEVATVIAILQRIWALAADGGLFLWVIGYRIMKKKSDF